MKYSSAEELATVYLRNWRENSDSDFWAHGEVLRLVGDEPEYCWTVILEMVRLAESRAALCYVAAGPLEALLAIHGNRYIELARCEAKSNPRFLYALANVWLDDTDEAYPQLVTTLLECGIRTNEDAETLVELVF